MSTIKEEILTLSPDQIVNLVSCLKNEASYNDPWSLQRIGMKFFNKPIRSSRDKYYLKKFIKELKKSYKELEYLYNLGQGYFVAKYVEEFEHVKDFYQSRINGLQKRWDHAQVGFKNAPPHVMNNGEIKITFTRAENE